MKPALLLIPGMLNTAALWREVAGRLGGDADVHVADVTTQDSIAAMASDAWQRVAGVARDTRLVVAGFSMGGYVAMQMLARPARRVDALALLDTSALPDSDAARERRVASAAAMASNFARVAAGIAANGTHAATRQRAAAMDELKAMFAAVGPQAGVRQLHAIIGRADHRAALAGLAIPVLVACGRDDRITPPEACKDLAALVPGARLEWIEQAGHMTPVEQPQRVAELLRELLQCTHQHNPMETR